MILVVDGRGVATCMYDEAVDLTMLGPLVITRAAARRFHPLAIRSAVNDHDVTGLGGGRGPIDGKPRAGLATGARITASCRNVYFPRQGVRSARNGCRNTHGRRDEPDCEFHVLVSGV